jgi:hypothetical protein
MLVHANQDHQRSNLASMLMAAIKPMAAFGPMATYVPLALSLGTLEEEPLLDDDDTRAVVLVLPSTVKISRAGSNLCCWWYLRCPNCNPKTLPQHIDLTAGTPPSLLVVSLLPLIR